MRDGVGLVADVWTPVGAEVDAAPTILIRTPYGRRAYAREEIAAFTAAGYVVVVQALRGKDGSEGTFRAYSEVERRDGHDTLTWLAEQPWCDGNIGTTGCSYLGEVQYLLLAERHPNHRAAIAKCPGGAVRTARRRGYGFVARGILQLGVAYGWCFAHGTKDSAAQPCLDVPREPLATLPVIDAMERAGGRPSDFEDWLAHPPSDPYWDAGGEIGDGDRFSVPALHISPWYDDLTRETLDGWRLMRERALPGSAGEHQYAIVPPTTHCQWDAPGGDAETYGDREVGAHGRDWLALYVAWFDRWLKGVDNGAERRPAVELFVVGGDGWRGEDAWPPTRAHAEDWFLQPRGGLAARPPAHDGDAALAERATTFTSDPGDPVPSIGPDMFGDGAGPGAPVDRRRLDDRHDVARFVSAPLERDVELTGVVDARLWVGCSEPDADVLVTLVDVFPDGRALTLCDGVERLRHRAGLERELPMAPGEVAEIVVELGALGTLVPAGHRLRVDVSPCDFPRFARNLHTGGDVARETVARTARIAVHHDRDHPSRIAVPVCPRDPERREEQT